MEKYKIKYHPVKKEMYFYRMEQKNWAEVLPEKSFLKKYINNKGNILLQDLGNELFDTIIKAADGNNKIELSFEGTIFDYEDLKKMINYYNKTKSTEIFSIGDLIELPDIQSIYMDMLKFGNDIIEIFSETTKVDKNIKDKFESIAQQLTTKMNVLEKSDVNLCVVGTYSSGKSTFINALLGKAIMPEAIKSETAKMFKIINSDKVKISFLIKNKNDEETGIFTSLIWNEDLMKLSFESAPKENSIRSGLQKLINGFTTEKQHEQIRIILNYLNATSNYDEDKSNEGNPDTYINGIINIYYEIPLSNGINFTIFDTPGTDSNSDEHLSILRDALREQTNSIMVFLHTPDKGEGKGNKVLFELLNNIENENKSITIDLNRSLHIMNKADSATGPSVLLDLQTTKINVQKTNKEDSDKVEISLDGKRLLFTSAYAGYAAKATLNGTASEKDIYWLEDNNKVNGPRGCYYKYNKLAASESETKELIETSERESKNVEKNKEFIVNSGLYAIEQEIVKYGQKYALAVKAKGLFDGIEDIVNKLDREYKSIKFYKDTDHKAISNKIQLLRGELTTDIEGVCKIFLNELEENKNRITSLIPELVLVEENIPIKIIRIKKSIDDRMPSWAFGEGKLESRHEEINKEMNSMLPELDDIYKGCRKKAIKQQLSKLKNKIREKIESYRDLDKEIVDFISSINIIDIPDPVFDEDIQFKEFHSSFIIIETINKKEYSDEMEKSLLARLVKRSDVYIDEITKILDSLANKMSKEFLDNIESVSGKLKDLMYDKQLIEEEILEVVGKIDDVEHKKHELNNKIWGKRDE